MMLMNLYRGFIILLIFISLGVSLAAIARAMVTEEFSIHLLTSGTDAIPSNKGAAMLPPRQMHVGIVSEKYPVRLRIYRVEADSELKTIEVLFDETIKQNRLIRGLSIPTRGIYVFTVVDEKKSGETAKVEIHLYLYGFEKDLFIIMIILWSITTVMTIILLPLRHIKIN